jgi:methyl-accepting chemotaxis protein
VVSGIEGVGEQVRAIAGSIATLSDGTLRIGEIIATVKDVAEQSNVLALNAAIEASKAGDHGRGFGVVASEMRSLADQSRRAAEQVRAILGEIQRGTRSTVDATEEGARRTDAALALARRAGDSIVGLAEVIRASSLAARQIANETRQQAVGVEQIVMAIGEVSEAVRHTADGTRDIERGTANLDTVSRRLASLVGRYQV